MDTDALRRAIHDAGGLASVADLARIWGVSVQRVREVVKHPDFPAPIGFTSEGRHPAWLVNEAQAFRDATRPTGVHRNTGA